MAKFVFNAGVFKDSPLFAAGTATQVTVIDRADDTLASLWADRAGSTPKSNPFFINEIGQITFYADAGRYQITAQNGGFSRVWEDVLLIDPTAGGGGGSNDAADINITDSAGYYSGDNVEAALAERGPIYPNGGGERTASYSIAAANWNAHDYVTGSATIVLSVPSGLPEGFVYFVTVDDGFSGTFTTAAGTGSPEVNAPYGKTLVCPPGGTIAVRRRTSGIIDVFGDGVTA